MRHFTFPDTVCPKQTMSNVGVAILILGLSASIAVGVHAGERAPEDIYTESCAVCHGVAGEGAMPGIPDLTEPNGSLSKPEVDLVRSIVNGVERPGLETPMPPSGLDENTVKAVLVYLRAMAAQSR
ncbi:MAG: c-type cytochrome [Rhodospirillales bacterium]|tara:strand:+ start:8805 stop:9182 length:378 start_codon:yes stop_codon:yes gene_type:complete